MHDSDDDGDTAGWNQHHVSDDGGGLVALAGLSASAIGVLVAFAKGPREFLWDYVLEFFVELALWVVYGVLDVIQLVADVLFFDTSSTIAEAFVAAFGPVAAVPVDLVRTMNELMMDLALSAGPFAPFLYAAAWALIVLATLALVRTARSRIPVIP